MEILVSRRIGILSEVMRGLDRQVDEMITIVNNSEIDCAVQKTLVTPLKKAESHPVQLPDIKQQL